MDTVTNPDSEVTKFEYLTDGRVKKITLRSTAGSNKATREFFYQDTNSSHVYVANKNKHLRKTLDKKQAGTVICSSEYDLDAAGNRLGRLDQDGKYDAWSYDPNQQLRAESRWSAKTPGSLVFRTEYGYDGNGNRTVMFEDGVKTAYTIGNNNEMTEAGTDDITYDFYGNAVFINSSDSYELAYDYERHLLEVYENETQVFRAEYDGDGRRMRVEYNQSGTWTHFVHCELTNEIIAEYTLVSTTFTIKCLNTYGIGLISSNRESTKRYFHFDGLGNTVALTDATENITDTYTWTAFGILDSLTGSSVNPYRYVGQWGYYDDGARGCPFEVLLLGVRYYIPTYGRFLTWDPVRQVNLYDYTKNSPTMMVDPDGLDSCPPQAQARCFAIGCTGCAALGIPVFRPIIYRYECRGCPGRKKTRPIPNRGLPKLPPPKRDPIPWHKWINFDIICKHGCEKACEEIPFFDGPSCERLCELFCTALKKLTQVT